jgi:hypothetical protein
MPWLGHDRYRAELDAETARFAEAVADADPARPVPTSPSRSSATGGCWRTRWSTARSRADRAEGRQFVWTMGLG